MNDAFASLKRQLAEQEENLRLIQDRKAQFVLESEIPLQLIKEEQHKQRELEQLRLRVRTAFRTSFETAGLLPYLPDRIPQEERLTEVFESVGSTGPEVPVFCLVRGGERECHDKFLERLQVRTLTSILGVDPDSDEDPGVRLHYLRWPSAPDRPARELLRQLAALPLPRRSRQSPRISPTPEAVQAALVETQCPFLLATILATDSWRTGETDEHVRAFARFWNDWPALAPGQILIVCLAVECRTGADPGQSSEFSARNAAIAQCFDAFRPEEFSRLRTRVLPPLDSIPLQPVKDWARIDVPPFREVIGVDSQVLANRVGDLYAEWLRERHSEVIPLQDLAYRLEGLLAELACQPPRHHPSSGP